MVKVLLLPGVEGGGPDRPFPIFMASPPFLFVGGSIGGLTIGGLPLLLIKGGAFPFFTLLVDGTLSESTISLSSTSAEDCLDFPNRLRKLLAKLPASLAEGVGGAIEGNEDLIGADLVLEGKLRFFSFYV